MWFKELYQRYLGRTSPRGRPRRFFRPLLEELESRIVFNISYADEIALHESKLTNTEPVTYTVVRADGVGLPPEDEKGTLTHPDENPDDDAGYSLNNLDLSWAIYLSNHDEGNRFHPGIPNKIEFNIVQGSSPHYLTPNATDPGGREFPAIDFPVIIDGTTNPDYQNHTPTIALAPNPNHNGFAIGLFIDAQNTTVRGLLISDFQLNTSSFLTSSWVGLQLNGTNAHIESNWIGTDATGMQRATPGATNPETGIIVSSGGNTIGGMTAGTGNCISGNATFGIFIDGTNGGYGTIIRGDNFIGTTSLGNVALPNASGIGIYNSSNNFIGDPSAAVPNVISGNSLFNVYMVGDSSLNVLAHNYIGTTSQGNAAIVPDASKAAIGVLIDGGHENTIGGTNANARNLISGNKVGVQLQDLANTNTVQGNYLGTDTMGSAPVGNLDGIVIVDYAGINKVLQNTISGNLHYGVEIVNAGDNNKLLGNNIGTDANGGTITDPKSGAKLGNQIAGVLIQGTSQSWIGSLTEGDPNVISGNATGILIQDDSNRFSTSNHVENNRIGTNLDGTKQLGNAGDGLLIVGSSGTIVAANTISGNLDNGIRIQGASATGTVMDLNMIGVNADGDAPLGNGLDGILIDGPQAKSSDPMTTTIISNNAISANGVHVNVQISTTGPTTILLSGTGGNGIEIRGGAMGVDVHGNSIGTDVTGSFIKSNGGTGDWLGNYVSGISIDGSSQIVIGGSNSTDRNVISGNGMSGSGYGSGVDINDGSSSVTVLGNSIGTDLDGKLSLPNYYSGINIVNSSNNNIGTTQPALVGNIISGNGQYGIALVLGSRGNHVDGNKIGTNADGTGSLKNGTGVIIYQASNNFIGTSDRINPFFDNLISGNSYDGIDIVNDSNLNHVDSNLIGTNLAVQDSLKNGGNGITINNSQSNFIGSLGGVNFISGNGKDGIDIVNQSKFNQVVDNQIGNNGPTKAVANEGDGIFLRDSIFNFIGLPGEGNNISGNRDSGVAIVDSRETQVVDNRIGQTGAPNNLGVLIEGSSDNTIGASNGRNRIEANSAGGILIEGPGSAGNHVAGNRIRANISDLNSNFLAVGVKIGAGATNNVIGSVDLTVDGSNDITQNDIGVLIAVAGTTTTLTGCTIWNNTYGDLVTADNTDVPNVMPTDSFEGSIHVEGMLHKTPNTAYRIEFFASASAGPNGAGEAELFLGAQTVTTNGAGDVSFRADFSNHVPVGWFTTMTVTGPDGNTSAFSPPMQVTTAPPFDEVSVSDVALPATDSGMTPFVFTVTRRNFSAATVVVQVDTADGTASAANSDYQPVHGLLLTFPAGGALQQQVTVLVNGDARHQPNKTFSVNLTNISGANIGKAGVGTILDHHPEVLSISNVTLPDGGTSGPTNFPFTVSLSGPTAEPISVQADTADGTATVAGGDYQPISGQILTFVPGGPTSQTVNVIVNPNTTATVDADEAFKVLLSHATGSNVTIAQQVQGAVQGVGTIQSSVQTVFSINDVTQSQGPGATTAFTFTISLANPSEFPVGVQVDTADGTATVAAGDYQPVQAQILTFNPGVLTQSVTVLVNNSMFVSSNKSFAVNLSAPLNDPSFASAFPQETAVSFAKQAGVGTILSNVTALSIGDVSLPVSRTSTRTFTFTVSMSSPSPSPVSVQVDTADGTATVADGDYTPIHTTLTFNPGGPLTQTVAVVVNADPSGEADESFSVNLSNLTGTNVSLAKSTAAGTILNSIVVTNTNDAGDGSLRQAILTSNAVPGLNRISFNIPGAGVIKPLSPLPTITNPVIIDGYTQPGASPNTLAQGDNAVMRIELNGEALKATMMTISAGNSTVRGLVFDRCPKGPISITGQGGNDIEGNFFGTDPTGAFGLGLYNNQLYSVQPDYVVFGIPAGAFSIYGTGVDNGVSSISSSNNNIGGTTPAARNLFALSGISISGNGNVVQGNYLGTESTGTGGLGSFGSGVSISGNGNTIGGTLAGAGNLISGYNGSDILITGSSNLVQGNFIGTDVTGSRNLKVNEWLIYAPAGVSILGGSNNIIGGTAPGARNVISGLQGARSLFSETPEGGGQDGVRILTAGSTGNLVQGNYIGTDKTGAAPISLADTACAGIDVQSCSGNTIGGTSAAARNLISANGVAINLVQVTRMVIQGNFMGTDVSGTRAISNGDGIEIFANSSANTIGGTAAGAGNLISGNHGSSILLSGDVVLSTGTYDVTGNVIQGNKIGTDVTGSLPLGNAEGILFQAATNNLIGGTSPGAGNLIAFNRGRFGGGPGVSVGLGTGNAIVGNSIFANVGLGIDLNGFPGPRGSTLPNLNDSRGHTGANHYQNFPVLISALSDSSGTTISGTLKSTAKTTFRLEFFADASADPSGYGQGQTFIGSTQVTTDASGNAGFTVTLPAALGAGQLISATATALVGATLVPRDTSEFCLDIPVTTTPDVDVSQTADGISVNAGATAGFTLTIANDGLNDATGLTLSDSLPAGLANDVNWQINGSSPNAAAFQITGAVGSQVLALMPGVTALAHGQRLTVHISGPTSAGDTSPTTFQGTLMNAATVNAANEPAGEQNDQASATITVKAPDVDVSQTADSSGINARATAGFTVVIRNEGAGDAAGLALSDALPAGLGNDINWQIDSGSADAGSFQITGMAGSQALSLNQGVTALGQGQILTVHIIGVTSGNDTDAATFQGTLSNTAVVNAVNELAGEQKDQASAAVAITAPDLDVSETVDSSSINAQDTAGFTLTIRNDGAGQATGVTVTDPLPAGLGNDINWQIDAASANAGAFRITGRPGSQVLSPAPSVTTLGQGQTLTVHITGVSHGNDTDPASFQGMLSNTATVNAANESVAEQNDQASASIAITAPDVDVSQTADKALINAGDAAGFTVTIRNEGNGTATAVSLFDALAAGPAADMTWAIDSATGNPSAFTLTGQAGNQVVSLAPAINTLAAGASLSVHLTTLTTTGDAGALNNSAFVDAGNEPDSERNDAASATIGVNPLGVVVTERADRGSINAGDTAGFTVTISNDTPINIATLSVPLPAGLGNDMNWQIDPGSANAGAFQITGTLGNQVLSLLGITGFGPGQTLLVHITGLTSANDTSSSTFQGTLSNTATVNFGSSLARQRTAQAAIVVNAPDVDVSQSADSAGSNAGQMAGFTVGIMNEGQGAAGGVTFSDLLPGGAGSDITWTIDTQSTAGAFSISGASAGQQSLTFSPTTLAAGTSYTVHLAGTVSAADAGTLTNTATVNAANELASEQNDQASAMVAVTAPDLDVVAMADAGPVNAGQAAGFSVRVFNEGQGAASGVTFSDALPGGAGSDITWTIDTQGTAGIFNISGSAGQQTLIFSPTSVAAGASFTVHVAGTVSAADAGTLTNTATVNAGNELASEQNDHSLAAITVTAPQGSISGVGLQRVDGGQNGSSCGGEDDNEGGETDRSGSSTEAKSHASARDDDGDDEDDHLTTTSYDAPQGGITIRLYRDTDGNGVLEGNDLLQASAVTAPVTGAYTFTGLSPGTYFVAEKVPAGEVEIAPAAPGYYTVVLQGGQKVTGKDFTDYCPQGQSQIQSSFNSTPIKPGSFLWFSSVIDPSGLIASRTTTVHFTAQAIDFTNPSNNTHYHLAVPDATLIFSPTTTQASTTFNTATNTWVTNLPASRIDGNDFISGLVFPVASSGLPGGIKAVTWSGQFDSDSAGVTLEWQWAAAVYSSFSSNYNLLGVKPVDSNSASQYKNCDRAGTPEKFRLAGNVLGGATGGGGSNWTGSYSGTAAVTPCNPAGIPLTPGQTATIGFWKNSGQGVIRSFNGGSNPPQNTALGSWLAANFSNLFGNLAAATNAAVANAFVTAAGNAGSLQGNTYAQAFAAALSVYTTQSSLGGASIVQNGLAAKYGFKVTAAGAGAATYKIGNNAAMGAPNDSVLSVFQILLLADSNYNPTTSRFYGGDASKTIAANNVLSGVSAARDVSRRVG